MGFEKLRAAKAAVFALSAATAALSLSGCATIIHGTTQDVGISSSPTGAMVSVDNSDKGMTPFIAKMTRKDNHIVSIRMAGYQPFDATVTRGVSGWVWGNIVFGGLIGLAVDAISGGIYKLTPEQISGTLVATKAQLGSGSDAVYIAVVLTPDPSWQKVGQLEP